MTAHAHFQGTERFEVLRHLGSGSFGSVYEVLDRTRGVRVALKRPHRPEAHDLLRFKQEFRTLAGVSHPNLVTLFELIGSEGQWFFTMELVEGVDLFTSLRGAPPCFCQEGTRDAIDRDLSSSSTADPPTAPFASAESWDREDATLVQLTPAPTPPPDVARVRQVFLQVAEGLRALHLAGLVHRDLKPSNVMVAPGNRVVILDFGLAMPSVPPGPAAARTLVTGTPAFLAPEQMEGYPASEAGDWYSFGVALFQVLTGVLPFTGNYRELLRQKRYEEAHAVDLLVGGIPEDLASLVRDLLHRDPICRPSGPEVMLRLDPAASPRSAQSQDEPGLPGCHPAALERLRDAWSTVQQGQPVVALMHGPPGIGKGSVVREFLGVLREHPGPVVVLKARCFVQESLPYKAVDGVVDSLAEHLRRMPALQQGAFLPPHASALARLFPVLSQIEGFGGEATYEESLPDLHTLRRCAFRALREILRRLAQRAPLVLVVEEMHWGDRDSEALLLEVLEAPDAPPLLLLLTCTTEERSRSTLLESLRSPNAPCALWSIGLDLLPPERCVEVAHDTLPADLDPHGRLAAWAARESGGHPFFLAELLHHLRQRQGLLPLEQAGLDAHLRARLDALPPMAPKLLEALAVAGHPVDWAVLTQAAGLQGEAEPLLPILRNAHVIRVGASVQDRKGVEFFHDRFRQAILQMLQPPAVTHLHRALAEAYERLCPQDVGALALHFRLAEDWPRAALHAQSAALAAAHALAFDRAAELYRDAIALRDPLDPGLADLFHALGDALAHAGHGPEAAEAYLQEASRREGSAVVRAHRRAAEEFFRSGHIARGAEILSPHLAAIGESFPATRFQTLASLAWWRMRLAFRRYRVTEEGLGNPAAEERVDLLWAAAMGLAAVDPFRSALFQARQLWHTLHLGEPFRVVRALAHETLFQALGGSLNLRRTREVLELTADHAATLDHPNPRGRALMAKGLSALCQGHWKRGAEALEEAERLLGGQCAGLDYEVHIAQHYSLLARITMGALPEVNRRLPGLVQDAKERGNHLADTQLKTGLGIFPALCRDDPGAALHDLREALLGWPQEPFQTAHGFELISRLNVELYCDRPFAARAHLRGAWPALRSSTLLRVQTLRITFLELRSRLVIACAARLSPDGLRRALLLSRARRDIRRLRREHVAYGEALALKQLACVRWLEGDFQAAESVLQQAADAFSACDMALHADVCRLALGRWTGDTKLALAAEGRIRALDILQPERWLAMHLPLGEAALRKR